MIKTDSVDITPAAASEYLSRAAVNRSIRRGRVEAYARDMTAGRWLDTGEPIKFASSGELIDGQHRLAAVIASGQTVRMLVVRGVPAEVISVLDSGAARSFADVLAIRGESSGVASTLAALTKRICLWDQGVRLQASVATVTHQELDQFLAAHPELRDYAKQCTGQRAHPNNVAASLFAAFITLASRIDADQAREFGDRWIDGISLPAEHPVLVLRERLASERLSYNPASQRFTGELKLVLAFTAWNAFREGRSLTRLQLPKAGLTNAAYPEPK